MYFLQVFVTRTCFEYWLTCDATPLIEVKLLLKNHCRRFKQLDKLNLVMLACQKSMLW